MTIDSSVKSSNRKISQFSLHRLSVTSWASFTTALTRQFSRQSSRDSNETQYIPVTVSSIRESILYQLKYDKSMNYHRKDIEKIQSNDRFIQRFIEDAWIGKNFNERITKEEVIGAIFKVLKWRQEFGINDFEPSDFPIEPFKCGLVRQGVLPSGDILFCIIGRKYQKVEDWTDIIISCIIWYYEQLEQTMIPGQKLALFFDITNCGLNQADSRLIFTGAPILINYYPGAISKVYFYQLPWLLKPFLSLFLSLLPPKFKQLVVTLSKKDAESILGLENVPDFLGGPVATSDLTLPNGMGNIDSVAASRGIRRGSIGKFRQVIRDASRVS